MKSLFRGHFNRTDDEFRLLWNEAVVSFDANVLLDLYRYHKSSADAFFLVLRRLQDRLWLPYQVCSEFFRHRDEEIKKQFLIYDAACKQLGALGQAFRSEFPRHTLMPLDNYADKLEATCKLIIDDITRIRDEHHDVTDTNKDPTLAELVELFNGKCGECPTEDEYKSLLEQSKRRCDKDRPPVTSESKDNKKKGDHKYGDAVIWLELLDYCKRQGKHLILVTSEKKSDWWSLFGNQRIGPRREMVQEFHQVTGGKLYHLYTSDAFLKYASDHLEIQARPEVIEDVKNVRKQRTAADHEATSYIALNEVRTEIDRIDSLLKEILPLAASARSGDSDKQQLSELKAMLQGIDLEDIAGQFDMTYHDAVASGGRLSPRMRRRLRLLSRRLAGIRKIYDEVYSVLVGATDSYPHF